jgi:hypothetical protein
VYEVLVSSYKTGDVADLDWVNNDTLKQKYLHDHGHYRLFSTDGLHSLVSIIVAADLRPVL